MAEKAGLEVVNNLKKNVSEAEVPAGNSGKASE